MKGKAGRVAAAIEIGSSAVRMRVAQWSKGKIALLDKLEKPTHIGQEVFTTGHIGFEPLRELSRVLEGFCDVAREYGVEKPRVVATSALREASNRAYILDHLRIRNRLDVEVLEEGEDNAVIFSEMLRHLGRVPERLLLVYAGTGSIGLSALENGSVAFSQSLHTGSLKITDMLTAAAVQTRRIDSAAEEYIGVHLDYARMLHDLSGMEDMAVAGNEIDFLCEICQAPKGRTTPVIQGLGLLAAWEQIKLMTPSQVAARYDIPLEQAEHLYAMLTIFAGFTLLTGAKRIHCPQVDLLESVLALQLRPGAKRAFDEGLRAGAVASAMKIAARYNGRIAHICHVARIGVTMFENLRKIHGLSRRQCTLLEVACLLHEIGYFVNARDAAAAAQSLIRDMSIYGLYVRDTELIACITSPSANAMAGSAWRDNPELNESDGLFIAKMHVILRIADALDFSCRQKAALKAVEVERNRLNIAVTVCEDFALEEWAFAQAAPLFEEVFGLAPHLSVERTAF